MMHAIIVLQYRVVQTKSKAMNVDTHKKSSNWRLNVIQTKEVSVGVKTRETFLVYPQ